MPDRISRDQAVSEANRKYEDDRDAALGIKKVCIVAASEWIPQSEHNYVPSGEYDFWIVDTDDKGVADKTISDMDAVYEGGIWETKAFGPFDEDFAHEVVSYLHIQSKMDKVNPESILEWTKERMHKLARD